MAVATEREQIPVPSTLSDPPGPDTGTKDAGLYSVVARATPPMADGSLHGLQTKLTIRGTGFDPTTSV